MKTVLCPPVSQRGPLVRLPRKVSAFGPGPTYIIPIMLSRFNINRITLLMHYFISRLGNLKTTFTAWYGTCTWCGCVFLYRWGFCIAHPPSASESHGSLTIANNVNLRLTTKVTYGAWRPIVTTVMRLIYTTEVCAVKCISVFWSHPFCRCRFSPPLNPCRGYRLL